MRRFAVKPTFRGWALYFFRGNEQVAYASGEQTVYLEGARAYSFSRLFSVPAFLILLIFWPTEAAGAWKRRYVVLRIALVLLASAVSYVLVCRGRLPGLSKGGETRRLNAVAPPTVQRGKLPSPAFLPSTDPARRGCTGGSGLYNKQTEMVVQYWIYSARGDSDTFVVDLYFAAAVPCARALYVWACMADGGCRSFAQFAGQTNSAALLPTLLEPGLHGSTGRGRRL